MNAPLIYIEKEDLVDLYLDELDHPFVDLADSHEDSEKDGSDDNSKRDDDSEREDEKEEE